jgi:hypothetical protein
LNPAEHPLTLKEETGRGAPQRWRGYGHLGLRKRQTRRA